MKPTGMAAAALAFAALTVIAGCVMQSMEDDTPGASGPVDQGMRVAREDGDAEAGRDVFRFETFGNEGFWTDAMRLPQGIDAAKVTPMQALELGLNVDVLKVPKGIAVKLLAELAKDPSGRTAAILNDPEITVQLVNANAVIGVPVKDSNGDGVIDVRRGDKAGASCALCHTTISKPIFGVTGGGQIGFRHDGPANHNLNFGKIAATAANSRALFPGLQLALTANGGKSLGRAPAGLTENSTEAEVDAYLSNPKYYPVGMFDDSLDGNGNPMHNTPFFRMDLAAPFGSDGSIARLDNFNNLVYTALFDPTNITTSGGRAFMNKLGGAAGDEIVDSYVRILKSTGVTGYPFVRAAPHPQPGSEDAPLGIRVDQKKLLDLNAYVVGLPAPRGSNDDRAAAARGAVAFRTQGCVSCHNANQSRAVPAFIVPMKTIFPGDNPVVMAQRRPPLNPIMDTPTSFFDDKMAVTNASLRGEVRGIAMPLLLDLARKPVFLHDNSVPNLDALLDSSRGADAPHAFFVQSAATRSDIIYFLKSLDDGQPEGRNRGSGLGGNPFAGNETQPGQGATGGINDRR